MNSRVIRWLLGILGFAGFTSCDIGAEMYGCPSADYVFNVEVKDIETDSPIKGIRVSAVERGERQYWDSESNLSQYEQYIDTLAIGTTSADGKLTLKYNSFPCNERELVADDVDGEANGSYASASVTITFDSKDYEGKGGNGWYSGTATENVTLKLSKK